VVKIMACWGTCTKRVALYSTEEGAKEDFGKQ